MDTIKCQQNLVVPLLKVTGLGAVDPDDNFRKNARGRPFGDFFRIGNYPAGGPQMGLVGAGGLVKIHKFSKLFCGQSVIHGSLRFWNQLCSARICRSP